MPCLCGCCSLLEVFSAAEDSEYFVTVAEFTESSNGGFDTFYLIAWNRVSFSPPPILLSNFSWLTGTRYTNICRVGTKRYRRQNRPGRKRPAARAGPVRRPGRTCRVVSFCIYFVYICTSCTDFCTHTIVHITTKICTIIT